MDQYHRQLDLEKGVARVSYRSAGVKWVREYFISAPDDLLVVRLAADAPGKVSARVSMSRPKDAKVTAVGKDGLHQRPIPR